MNETDLRTRFHELREEEREAAPPFARVARRPAPRRRRLVPAFAMLFLLAVVIGVVTLRPRPETSFSAADTEAARAIGAWRAPTDSLLHPPGSEVLTSLPAIPSKGVPR